MSITPFGPSPSQPMASPSDSQTSPPPLTPPVGLEPKTSPEPKASYVKLAMRNMVAKGAKSLKHFGLTALGLLAVLVGLAYLTKP